MGYAGSAYFSTLEVILSMIRSIYSVEIWIFFSSHFT